jgi:peptide/nickel transport system permease protein
MWSYVARRLLANVPVYLTILLVVMGALRVGGSPANAYMGKGASAEEKALLEKEMGLDRPFLVQYADLVEDVITLDFSGRSWEQQRPVGEMLANAIPKSIAVMLPSLMLTTLLAVGVGLISAFYRGSPIDRTLVILAVLGMCVSYLVYIIFGQYFGAYRLQEAGFGWFAIEGYEPSITIDGAWWNPASWSFSPSVWIHYCLLPVLINVIVALGYDTRFYRAVMVEEGTKDYITTARAKGATKRKIMFVHMLKNAMIPIITRIMITIPFLVVGSLLVEVYFNIPGMGRTLITAIHSQDFPVIQAFVAVFAGLFIITNILTDVLYAAFDPRVRLS